MGYTRVSKGAFLMESLIFTDTDKIGQVIHVDTAQIIIELSDSEQISKIIIGNLVAIETSKKHEFLIGLIDKVTRKYIEEIASEESNVSDEDILMTGSSDYIKINIIGTYKSVYGSKRNVFKRGVDSFPKIESSCYSICGENLQKFMNILGQNINSTKPLKIGSFMIDNNTEAILDGNKFFQRHSAILGSTGSGKSWCVANILEKASELKNANIIVFDLHGEYKPLYIEFLRQNKNILIAKFEGIDSINDLLPYKGELLFVDEDVIRDSLDEDEFLIDELVGLNVFDNENGKKLGFVIGVSNNGASDLISVKTNSKKVCLIPFVKAIVPVVDLKGKKIVINNLEGLLE